MGKRRLEVVLYMVQSHTTSVWRGQDSKWCLIPELCIFHFSTLPSSAPIPFLHHGDMKIGLMMLCRLWCSFIHVISFVSQSNLVRLIKQIKFSLNGLGKLESCDKWKPSPSSFFTRSGSCPLLDGMDTETKNKNCFHFSKSHFLFENFPWLSILQD